MSRLMSHLLMRLLIKITAPTQALTQALMMMTSPPLCSVLDHKQSDAQGSLSFD